jgi:oligosaccharyltransferase complex subunit delta (ribophorin II)
LLTRALQSHKDLPVQLLVASKPLKASVVIGSFGSAQALNTPVFEVKIETDANAPPPTYEKPLRYGQQPEIQHTFRPDAKSPPKVISLVFGLAVLATLPVLLISVSFAQNPSHRALLTFRQQWATLGGNLNHLSKAIGAAPLSHATFFGSIVAMEFVFFMYYTTWNLFQVLPLIGAVGAITVFSGTKALGEVQSRRLAGER